MIKRLRFFLFSLFILPCLIFSTGCTEETTENIQLTYEMVELSETEIKYNGMEQKPIVTVSTNDYVIPNKEYTVEYLNNTEIGTASVIVSSNPNSKVITGKITKHFTIIEDFNLRIKELESDMIGLPQFYDYSYNENQKRPRVEVFFKNINNTIQVVPHTEYSVRYAENINSGPARVIVVANKNSEIIKGSASKTFTITKSIAKVDTLETAQKAINNLNYSKVKLDKDLTINSNEILKINKDREFNIEYKTLTNNGLIINNGHIISNNLIKGTGNIKNLNNAKITANVYKKEDFYTALHYATNIVLKTDISELNSNFNPDPIIIDAKNKSYEFDLDLNGFNIFCGLSIQTNNVVVDNNVNINIVNLDSKNPSQIGSENISYGLEIFGNNQSKIDLTNINIIGKDFGIITHKDYDNFKLTSNNCKYFATLDTNYANDSNTYYKGGLGAYLESNAIYKFNNCTFSGLTGYYTRSGNNFLNSCEFIGYGQHCDYKYSEPNNAYSDGSAVITNKTTGFSNLLYVKINNCNFYSEYSYGWHDFYTAENNFDKPTEPMNKPTIENISRIRNFKFGPNNLINIHFKSEINTINDNIVWG